MREWKDALGIPGLVIVNEYISLEKEKELLAAVDEQEWDTLLDRRVQHYGFRYNYSRGKRGASKEQEAPPIPPVLAPCARRLLEEGHFAREPEQVIVNEYEPGQGISAHVDHSSFGPVVASLSLGSDCVMIFEHKPTKAKKEVVLERGSLAVLTGAARTEWTHSIPKRKKDAARTMGGTIVAIERKRRVSVTFRTLKALDDAAAESNKKQK